MLSEAQLSELLSFLRPEARVDVKAGAVECVLGLSGNRDGCLFLGSKPDLLRAVWALTSDPSNAIVKDAYFTFINLSAEESLHQVLVSELDVLPLLCQNLLDPSFMFSDQICTVLSNLSRSPQTCAAVYQVLQEKMGLSKLVQIFCEDFNPKASLHFIAPLLSNLSRLQEAQEQLLDPDRCVVQRLLPFTQFEGSVVRRGGVIGTLRNLCFNHKHHERLLSDDVDVLPFLLLPLAGPEELSDEENEGLPLDLQYLPEDKQRESDPDLRKMLLETLLLLCATSRGRRVLKDRQVYPLMRELHRWEPTAAVRSATEKLIQVLIGDEPEQGMENLMEVTIPEDVEKQLRDADAREQELDQD